MLVSCNGRLDTLWRVASDCSTRGGGVAEAGSARYFPKWLFQSQSDHSSLGPTLPMSCWCRRKTGEMARRIQRVPRVQLNGVLELEC
jgi:hypothetical protein